MQITDDEIVDISTTLEKFFGCSGKMLKPSRATLLNIISEIPLGQLVTTELLRKELASRFQVEVTCPYITRIVLLDIANSEGVQAAWWRVLKSNGELNPGYPAGTAGHAALLTAEGFQIESSGGKSRVAQYRKHLVTF